MRRNLGRPQLSGAGVRPAIVAVAILSGCAGWIEGDDVWLDAPDVARSPEEVYAYGSVPIPRDEPAIEDERVIEDEPRPGTVEPVGRRLGIVTRCRFFVVVETRPSIAAIDIRRTVQRHENDVRVCYNRALRRDPTAAGRVTMTFLVQSDGTVPAAYGESSALDDPELFVCIAHAIKGWTFPVPVGAGPALVHYPFVFSVPRKRR